MTRAQKSWKEKLFDNHNEIELNRCTVLGLVVFKISFKINRTKFYCVLKTN